MKKINKVIAYIVVALSAFYYHPYIESTPLNALFTRITLFVLVAISFVISFRFKIIKCQKPLKIWAVIATLVGLQALFFYGLGISNAYIENVKALFFTLFAVVIGYSLNLNNNEYKLLIVIYGIILAISGISQIFTNFGGFVIESRYANFAKNSFGPMLTTCIIASLYLHKDLSGWKKVALIALNTLNIFILVTIRARASMVILLFVATLLFTLKIIRKKYNEKHIITSILIISISFVLATTIFQDTFINIGEYVYKSFFINTEFGVDITSGRTERNLIAINTFSEHPFFGLLGTNTEIPWVHNYPLLVLSSYGLIGGFFLLSFYIYFSIWLLKQVSYQNILYPTNAGYICALSLIASSLAEPTFPYLPGSAVVFTYFLLGICYSKDSVHKTNEKKHSHSYANIPRS